MTCLKKTLLSLMLIVVSSKLGQCESNNRSDITHKLSDSKDTHCSNDSTCPTWFICNSEKNCQCGNRHTNAIACDDETLTSAVLDCHCVTYDGESGSTFVGSCFYNCENHNPKFYHSLPKRPEILTNTSACSHFHRTGLLCGDCEGGHSPFVLSYNLSCVECPDGHKNWWKFILVGFLPLTFFYFFLVLFNVNVTSSHLHGVVWYSQALSMPVFVRVLIFALSIDNPELLKVVKAHLVLYSFWNLDLFRSVIPDVCLNVTTLQALALDYLVALYPFVLIMSSYLAIELYDRKFPFIVSIWKPFHKVLTKFRRSWDIRTSVIDSFATFFLLSYIKVLSVTTDLLVPTQIYNLGANKSTFGLYYSPSVIYFGDGHLPYAILAIVILTLFVSIPTVTLVLYPFQFFQKFLSSFPFNWHFLHAFVDSFQGCYKDGTEPGTFDCRWFSALMLLVRSLLFIALATTLSVMFFVYALIVLLILLIAIINIQPYKKIAVRYPSTDLKCFVLLSLFYVMLLGRDVAYSVQKHSYHTAIILLAFSSAFVPLIYITYLIGSWLVSRSLRR